MMPSKKIHGQRFLAHARIMCIVFIGLLGACMMSVMVDAQDCANFRGTLVGHSTGPDSFVSDLTGDLEGTLVGTHFQIVQVGEDGTLHFVVDHEFITTRGTFYTVAEGVLSPIGPGIYTTSERNFFLPGGTDDFAGAEGTLIIQTKDFNASTGQFSGVYHGRICTGV